MEVINRLWRYRGFIFGSVRREFQSKYRNSLLGAVWNIVNPLSMIVVATNTSAAGKKRSRKSGTRLT